MEKKNQKPKQRNTKPLPAELKKEPVNKVKNPKTKKQSKWKTAGLIILSVITAICLAIDIWFIYIKFWAPQKYISNTFEVGMQTAENGDQKPFIELKYYSNANANGYECLDIKYNFLLDENKSSLYSQGIQYVADSQAQSNSLNFKYYADTSTRAEEEYDKTYNFGSTSYYYHCFGTYQTPNFKTVEYQSIDNYANTTLSTNPIDIYTGFKLEIGEDIFLVKFRGNNDYNSKTVSKEKKEEFLNKTYVGEAQFDAESYLVYLVFKYDTYHCMYDVNYLNKLLFESLAPLANGAEQTVVYDFPDMFDYYKYDSETKQYSDTREVETTKIRQEIKNYYSIKVSVSPDGLQKSSDSLFNCFNGQSTFNLLGDYVSTDYFIGRTVIHATLNNFDLIKLENGTYDIKLNDKFIADYEQYKGVIYLNLNLDYTNYENEGKVVNEPTLNSVCGFNVYKLNIIKTRYGG